MTEPRSRDVPDRPTVVLLDGDGVGPEVVAHARRVVDHACERAYAKKRRIDWKPMPCGSADDGLPRETLDEVVRAKLVLRGPMAESDLGAPSRAGAIGAALDLFVATIRFEKLTLLVESSEGAARPAEAAPASVQTDAFLGHLKRDLSTVATAVRFGTRERVESYLRSLGRRETALVETGLAVELTSRAGVERFVEAAMALAKREGRHRLTLAVDPVASPQGSTTFTDLAYRVASERFPGDAFTWPDYQRASVRGSVALAEKLRDEALEKRLWVEPRTLASLCEEADSATSLDLVVARSTEGGLLAHLFAARSGGAKATAVVRSNPLTGAAVGETLHGTAAALRGKDEADPSAAIRAAAELLATVGWSEVATSVSRALAQASGARARGAKFADAVIAALG